MARVEEIVGKIRGVVQSGDLRATEELLQLAQQYREVCESTLRRLQRCDEYLFQGRYPEAIHLASQPRPLLDVVSALNFPEAQAWHDVLLMYNWPAAPRIGNEQVTQLNLAFGVYPAVEPLFKEYRRAVLNNAPLAERLRILREIEARLGQVYPAIDKQIRELEAERLKVVGAELQQALLQKNVDAVRLLYAELSNPAWRSAVPQEWLAKAANFLQAVHLHELRQELDKVGQRLRKAMVQRDFTSAQQLFQQWNQLAAQAGVTPGDELWIRYREPCDWIRELLEVYAVVSKPDVTIEELAAYEEIIFRWRKFLPPYLEQVYDQALREAETVETRWRQTLVALAVLACLVLFVLVVLFLTLAR